jgi:hypothetical protein
MKPCPDCSAHVASTASICPNCGADLNSSQGKWKTADKIAIGSLCVSAITLVLTILGAIIAYTEFKAQDDWKRREFVYEQIKEFYADKINDNVLTMLDYNLAEVNLYPNASDPSKRIVLVKFTDFVTAISADGDKLSGESMALKEQFEHFLKSISRFSTLQLYGVVPAAELCGEFQYPLSLLAGDPRLVMVKKQSSKMEIEPLARAVAEYFQTWDIKDVPRFIKEMGRACGFAAPFLKKVRQPTR